MKTGEGKTFVSPMTAFAKVLDGQKVHVLTVNDYLVERDYTLLLPVYEMLGLSVGYITTETPIEERKKHTNVMCATLQILRLVLIT